MAGNDSAWNQHMNLMVKIAEIHTQCYLLEKFCVRLTELPSSVRPIVEACGRVYFLGLIEAQLDGFLEEGFIDGRQSKTIRSVFLDECALLRKEAIALTDALGYPDFILKAPIGRFDGDIYPGKFPYAKLLTNHPSLSLFGRIEECSSGLWTTFILG